MLYHARASIHTVTSCNHILPRLQYIINSGVIVILHHVNAKDLNETWEIQNISPSFLSHFKCGNMFVIRDSYSSYGDTAINVWGSVQRIKHNNVSAISYEFFFFFNVINFWRNKHEKNDFILNKQLTFRAVMGSRR